MLARGSWFISKKHEESLSWEVYDMMFTPQTNLDKLP